MSKIYEALLRAERDRQGAGTVVEDRTPAAVARPASFPAAPAADYADSAEPVRTEEAAAPAGAANVSVWTPDYSKLLALETTGSHVEQFRSLRSKLFEFRDLNKLKSVLVSSGLPEEGKSFVAANLAVSFARHKSERVLLIDGDLRRGTQHKLLGSSGEIGLAEYLSGKATIDEIVHRGTKADGEPLPPGLATLSFIPAGEAGDRAADLSGSAQFSQLIRLLSPQYDWIVVDSSPVNLVTDGANLARACDGVLMIARGGVTRYESAQRALSELKASKVLGVVLNAVDETQSNGQYYGYDGYDRQSQ